MTGKVQILRTETANAPPSNLLPGELCIEMAVPTRLWVGVPNYLDGSGKKLLFDSSNTLNNYYTKPESDARFVKIPGDTMTGTLTINADLRLWDAGATYYGTLGHRIARIPDTGRLLIGGGQDIIEFDAANPIKAMNSLYVDLDITAKGNIVAAKAVNALESMYCGGAIYSTNGNIISQADPLYDRAQFLITDENKVVRVAFFWHRADNLFVLRNQSAGSNPGIDFNDFVYYGVGASIVPGLGINGRAGTASGSIASVNNFAWDGANLGAYVDATFIGNVTVSSDYRIKKDVLPLPSMWAAVKALKPISYTHRDFTSPADIAYRADLDNVARERGQTLSEGEQRTAPAVVADDIERWGFVAHELQETLIESVATGVKDSPDVIQSPNPWPVIASLTKALQEAMARIEALEAKA